MTYGISVQNSLGRVIIDENTFNYQVTSSGTLSNSTTMPNAVDGEILFVRPSTHTGKMHILDRSPQKLPATFWSSSGSYQWVRARRVITAASETYGFRVFSQSGNLTFDSGRRQLVPITNALMSVSLYTPRSVNLGVPVSILAGRQRYVEASALCFTGLLGAMDATYVVGTHVVWNADNSVTIQNGQDILGFLPPGFVSSEWANSVLFSFADF